MLSLYHFGGVASIMAFPLNESVLSVWNRLKAKLRAKSKVG